MPVTAMLIRLARATTLVLEKDQMPLPRVCPSYFPDRPNSLIWNCADFMAFRGGLFPRGSAKRGVYVSAISIRDSGIAP